MTSTKKPTPPTGLKARGKRFWTDVTGSFDLEPSELLLLGEAGRVIDECERLAGETDPRVVTELRLQRLLLARLIAQLDVPESEVATGMTLRGRAGAKGRWRGHVVRDGGAA